MTLTAAQVAEAFEALRTAARHLRCGDLDVSGQMRLANRCDSAAWPLKDSLGDIKVEVANANS